MNLRKKGVSDLPNFDSDKFRFSQLSKAELINRAAKSEDDIRNKRTITIKSLRKEVQIW